MKLHDLIAGLPLRLLDAADANVDITGISDDSRLVRRGELFVARQGVSQDGSIYIDQALKRGAKAVVAGGKPRERVHRNVPWCVGADIDQALVSELAGRVLGHPSRALRFIGVTGTNGKTTIAFLVRHLLSSVGVKCGMMGTVFNDLGDEAPRLELAGMTNPGPVQMQQMLAAMVRNRCGAAVCELSSHGLHQRRSAAIDVDAAIFTNLTGDHLDYHGSMDAYAAAKAMLFESLKPEAVAVVNADDEWSARMVRDCRARVLWCTTRGEGVGSAMAGGTPAPPPEDVVSASVGALTAAGSTARLRGPWGERRVTLPLIGRHNVANALQALAAADAVSPDVDIDMLFGAVEQFPGVPGRLERVQVREHQPTVLVDYAHTDDALKNVLSALKPLRPTGGRLIVVFGCGGDRDRTKRPRMAQVACTWADRVVVTSDNPRSEAPQAIIDDILEGVPAVDRGGDRVTAIADRAEAIRAAIEAARERDIVLIAGKGHEDYQEVCGQRRHFDDREVAGQVLGESDEAT